MLLIAVLLPLATAARHVLSFERLSDALTRIVPASRAEGPGRLAAVPLAPQRMGVLVDAVARNLKLGSTCLDRSLVLWALLRRYSLPGQLHIGVRQNQGRHELHAWVTRDGVALNDAADVAERYQTLLTRS